MNTVHTMLMALLAVSGATSAQAAAESSQSAEEDVRFLVAQAEAEADHADAERTSHERESRRRVTDQEALALAAMEGLMAQPPERALPIIKKVLAGSQTTLVKQRALFVLSQIDSPEAERILIRRVGRRIRLCDAKPFAASASVGTRSRSPHCRRSTARATPM